MKQLLPLLFIALGCIACGEAANPGSVYSTPDPATSGNRMKFPNSSKTYGYDLDGQVVRIVDEGTDNSAILKNVTEAEVDYKSFTYAHLTKNADRYAGKSWYAVGKILQITESGASTSARIAIDGQSDRVIYIVAPFQTNFVENDKVLVIGYLAGNYTYTSQANWQITIPALAARAILPPGDMSKLKAMKTPALIASPSPRFSPSPLPSPIKTAVPSTTRAPTPMFQGNTR